MQLKKICVSHVQRIHVTIILAPSNITFLVFQQKKRKLNKIWDFFGHPTSSFG